MTRAGAVKRTHKPASKVAKDAAPMPLELLKASAAPEVVTVPARKVVAIEGPGSPHTKAFRESLGALYGAAYGLKFARKKAGDGEFKVGALEGRWWAEGAPKHGKPPMKCWRWRMRIAVPGDVSDKELAAVIKAAIEKKGGKLEGSAAAERVFLEKIPKVKMGRILHLGHFATEHKSFARLDAHLAAQGLEPSRTHLEIYLTDPNKVPESKLRIGLMRELR